MTEDHNEDVEKPEWAKATIRKVGWVFIYAGLLDVAFSIYSLTHQAIHFPNFGVSLFIVAAFLFRGGVKGALFVSWMTAFGIAGSVGGLIAVLFTFPFGLILTYIKLEPVHGILISILLPAIMALNIWAYRTLTSPVIRAATEEALVNYRSSWLNPARGLWVGGCLGLIFAVSLPMLLRGATANEAKRKAAIELGDAYKYCVTSMSISSTNEKKHVQAVVTAYNSEEIKNIAVEWSE